MDPAPPFAVAVCGIGELAGHGTLGATHVLSILDPDHPVPDACGTFGEHAKLELRFHDIVDPRPGEIMPSRAHVDAIPAFGRTLRMGPAGSAKSWPPGPRRPCRRVAARTSCGVLVTDGLHILLGHATRTPRWDIPKGLAGPGEALATAAARELREETGLLAEPCALVPLGIHAYLRAKDLALFAWRVPAMPDPTTLRCASMVSRPGQAPFPELDRFAVLPWNEVLERVGRNMARVLALVRPRLVP